MPLGRAACGALTSHVNVDVFGRSYVPLMQVNNGSAVLGKQLG